MEEWLERQKELQEERFQRALDFGRACYEIGKHRTGDCAVCGRTWILYPEPDGTMVCGACYVERNEGSHLS
jgi:hypothetical protein